MKTGSKLLDYSQSKLFGIELAFIELTNYQSAIEKLLEEQKIRTKNFLSEYTLPMPEKSDSASREHQVYLLQQSAEIFWEISELYPHNFRASFLTQIISFIEYELKKISNHCQKINNSSIRFSSMKGNGDFEKSELFLTRIGGVNFSTLEPEWSYINSARVIRNKIIHQQGVLQKTDRDFDKIDSFVNKQKGLTYKLSYDTDQQSSDEVTLLISSIDFTSELLRNTELFFINLLNKELKYTL